MPIVTIARKDLRLLLRDPRSAVILLLMPLILMLILGLTLGRAFGEKPDSKIRISIVVEDTGLSDDSKRDFPPKAWSDILIDDLADTEWKGLPAPTSMLGCVVAGDAVRRRVRAGQD